MLLPTGSWTMADQRVRLNAADRIASPRRLRRRCGATPSTRTLPGALRRQDANNGGLHRHHGTRSCPCRVTSRRHSLRATALPAWRCDRLLELTTTCTVPSFATSERTHRQHLDSGQTTSTGARRTGASRRTTIVDRLTSVHYSCKGARPEPSTNGIDDADNPQILRIRSLTHRTAVSLSGPTRRRRRCLALFCARGILGAPSGSWSCSSGIGLTDGTAASSVWGPVVDRGDLRCVHRTAGV